MAEETGAKALHRPGRLRSAALIAVVLCLAVLWLVSRPVDRWSAKSQEPGARGWAQGVGVPETGVQPVLRSPGGWAGTAQLNNDRLIGMLAGEDTDRAAAAADELLRRDLGVRELDLIREVVERVPFRDYGCMRPTGETSNASGSYAWKVLEAKLLPRLSQEKQIEWLMAWVPSSRSPGRSAASEAGVALANIGPPAIPRLREVLTTGSEYQQEWAGAALMRIGTDDALMAVERWGVSAVESTQDFLVRTSAAQWLGLLQSKAAFEPLVRVMWAHLNEAQTWQLIVAVEDTGQERAIPELAKVLETPAGSNRKYAATTYLYAAQALAELGDARGREALRAATTSADLAMRWETSYHLACLGKTEQRQLLERLAKDPDERTASGARMFLHDVVNAQPIPRKPYRDDALWRLSEKQRERHAQWAEEHGG